jgi:autotransporter-associated beta strand protein
MKKTTLTTFKPSLASYAAAALLGGLAGVSADPKTWTGAADGSWLTGGNWSPSALITSADGVIYDASSVANLTQALGQNWGITNLTVGAVPGPITISGANGLTNSGPIDMSAASADLTIDPFYQSGVASGSALTIAAGRTLTLHNTSGNMNNATGPGRIRLLGAKTGQFLDLKGGITLSVDGGSVSSGPPVRLTAGAGETVLVEVKNNGAINLVSTGNGIKLNVGNNASVTGTNIVRVESGTLWITNSTGTGANGIFVANENCYGILDINGGTVDLTNKLTASTGYGGESVLRVPGHAAGQAVVNLNGGVLIVPRVDSAAAPVYDSYFYFNGGVMQANRNGTQWMQGLQHALIKAGGAILDSSTFDVTIAQPLQEEATSPGGGLTKRGSGILRLTGYNTYTGPTVVAAGTLFVAMATSSYPSSSALVASNGTTLNIDITGGSTLQTPSAKLDGTILNLTYGTLSGNPSQAAINNSSFSGIPLSATGTNVINISGTGFAENGVVPLIDYAGPIGGSGYAAFKLGTLPSGVSGVLSNDTVNGMIVLHLGQVPAMLTWYGDKSANWDTGTLNWNTGNASYDQTGGVGDIVTFDDTLEPTALNTNVTLTTTLIPTIIQVANSTYDYVFGGPGKLSGTGMLNKSGTSALTLLTANNYSGGSYLSNGVVRLGNDAALGTGAVNLLGGTLSSDSAAPRTMSNTVFISAAATFGDGVNSGVLMLAGPVNFNGGTRNLTPNSLVVLSGGSTNGGLYKLGTNTLVFLNCTNTFTSGSSEVRQGTVALTNALITSSAAFRPACNVPGGEARLLIGPGSVWENSGASGSFRVGTQGTAGDPTATNIADIAGELRVPNAAPPGGRLMFSSNYIGFVNLLPAGLATVTAVVSENGTNSTAYQEFNFNGGTLRAMTNASSAFMQGLGAAYVRAGGAVVDSDGANITITQNLLNGGGGGGLTKLGTGTLTLSGTNDYTGPTILSAGTLLVGGDSSAAHGSVTVQSGATLGGSGKLGGAVTVGVGGTLAPGNGGTSIGTLTMTSSLLLRGKTVMELTRDGSLANDAVAGLTGVTYGGSLVLTNIGAAPLILNDTFVLFSAPPGAYGGAFTNFTVPAGYTFDLSKLTVDGSVKVTGIPSAIPNTPTNITYSMADNQLTLSWPANYKGCYLQGQTNLLSVGLSTNWVNVPNSENVTSVTFPVDPARGSVFFRLRHP